MSSKKPLVLVAVIRAGPKTYCNDFYPAFAQALDYDNKDIVLFDENNCPALKGDTLGETICANGRQCAVEYARKHGHEYIFFLDLDFLPDADLLDKLVENGNPLVGCLVSARGNPYQIIGHNYVGCRTMERAPLYFPDLVEGQEVDGISGAALLVHKSIFEKIDYTGYIGPDTIPGRYTADDEFYQLKIHEQLGIKPIIILSASGWHYNSDGFKYRILGQKKNFTD